MMMTTPPAITYGHAAAIARFSVANYQRMIETGIITAEDKVELLENYVVLKMPRNPTHDIAIEKVLEALFPRRLAGWRLRIQSEVELADDSQPEPDFAFVRGILAGCANRHPGPADVGSLIEVADSSLLRDQRDKTRIYARAGIPWYWIVNLVDRRIEVYSQPSTSSSVSVYGMCQIYQPGDDVPIILDGMLVGTVPAIDLLP